MEVGELQKQEVALRGHMQSALEPLAQFFISNTSQEAAARRFVSEQLSLTPDHIRSESDRMLLAPIMEYDEQDLMGVHIGASTVDGRDISLRMHTLDGVTLDLHVDIQVMHGRAGEAWELAFKGGRGAYLRVRRGELSGLPPGPAQGWKAWDSGSDYVFGTLAKQFTHLRDVAGLFHQSRMRILDSVSDSGSRLLRAIAPYGRRDLVHEMTLTRVAGNHPHVTIPEVQRAYWEDKNGSLGNLEATVRFRSYEEFPTDGPFEFSVARKDPRHPLVDHLTFSIASQRSDSSIIATMKRETSGQILPLDANPSTATEYAAVAQGMADIVAPKR